MSILELTAAAAPSRAAAALLWCLAGALGAGCSEASNGPASPTGPAVGVTAEDWAHYAATSASRMAVDKAAIDAELAAIHQATMGPAPHTDADFKIDGTMTDAWFRTSAAATLADEIVSFQTPAGGWSKHMDYSLGPRRPGESFSSENDGWDYVGTIDNGTTTTQITFLARAYQGQSVARWRDAALRGLDYLLLAQYPNGCWPQVYPLMGGYHDDATYNDDATTHVLSLFRDVGKGGIYSFASADAATRLAAGLDRGLACVLSSQIVVGGVKTAWGQQHDPRTLEPVIGRSYELPGISGQESAGILNFLMSLASPDAKTVAAVHPAVDWLRATAISGVVYNAQGGLTPQPGAGPIWARISEIGTNRPIFANRDGIKLYDVDQLTDRRTGYSWFGTTPAATLKTYTSWSLAHPRQP